MSDAEGSTGGATRRGATRRGLIRGAIGGGAFTAFLAAAGEGSASAAPRFLQGGRTEPELLGRLAGFELLAVFVYQHLSGLGSLDPHVRATVRSFGGQERKHAQLLIGLLQGLGQAPPAPPPDVATADRELVVLGVAQQLSGAKSQSDALHLLIQLEYRVELIYYSAIQTLTGAAAVRLAAGILACEAQHEAVLSGLLRPGDLADEVPRSFAPFEQQVSTA